MQVIATLAYLAIGFVVAHLGNRFDVEKRPGRKSKAFLFVEFILVMIFWPAALVLAVVAVACLRIAHHLHHKKPDA